MLDCMGQVGSPPHCGPSCSRADGTDWAHIHTEQQSAGELAGRGAAATLTVRCNPWLCISSPMAMWGQHVPPESIHVLLGSR